MESGSVPTARNPGSAAGMVVARMRPLLVLLCSAAVLSGCGDSGEHATTSSAPGEKVYGSASASGAHPTATLQSRDIPNPPHLNVLVYAKPRQPIVGSFTVRCYADGEVRSQEVQLRGTPPIDKIPNPTIEDADYCQVDGQVSYANDRDGGRVELLVTSL